MNKLTITIAGPTGSGRTTLAYYVAEILKDDGLDVEVHDEDDDTFVVRYKETDNKYAFFDRISRNLAEIAKNTQVVIETKQTTRRTADPTQPNLTTEYEWSSAGGTAWMPCRIIAAVGSSPALEPNKVKIWFDPFNDGVGEVVTTDVDRIRYVNNKNKGK